MVFISSIKVLGERTVDRPFHPDDPHAPIDPYGRSKAAAERSLSEIAARTGLELVVVRPPLVHGRGAAGNLAMLARLLLKRIPLPIASIDNRRSMVGAGSLAELLLQAASATATGTYHVSDRYPISTPTLVRALGRGLKVRPILLPFPPGLLRMAGKLAGRSAVMERLGGSLEVDAASTVRDFEWQPSDRTEAELAAAAPSMVGHRE